MNKLVARLAALVLTIGAVTSATAQILPPPPPTGSLVVTLASPGSTVSGTVQLNASVSIVGSLSVSRVEFFANGNFIGSDFGSPYSVFWDTTRVSNGSYTLSAVAVDALGVRWNSNSVTVNVSNGPPPDTTRPTVTINRAATQADPTSTSPINFTVAFSEPVSGFTNADVAISGTAAGTKTVTVSGSGSTYTVAVSGMTTSGTVVANIGAGAAQDAAGNTNTASTSTDNSVQFNFTPPAPTITSFTPANGPVGTTVTITGTNFTGATAVTFNTVSAGFVIDSATSIRTQVPAGATTGSIRVTTPGGTATSTTSFTVTPPPAPTITSFTPTNGPVGTVVTITGTNFTGATAVTFNTESAGFIIDSATSIRTQVPAGATTGSIRVTTPGGTATSSTNFTVTPPPAPTITSFTPANGPVGTVVTITGTNFTGATAVTFNTVSAGFVIDSATSIRTEVPAGATTGSIRVTTPSGTATSTTSFTVTTTTSSSTATDSASDTRSEESAASLTGSWTPIGSETGLFSGGTAVVSNDASSPATATFSFTGTAVSWIGLKCNICGIATVSIDGGAPISVDTAGPGIVDADPATPLPTSEVVFSKSGLDPAVSHTIVITVTGSTTSGGAHIAVDAFDVTGGTGSNVTRMEDTDPSVSYIQPGDWIHRTDDGATAGTLSESTVAGAEATLSFTGTEVLWIGLANENGGIARVFLDGEDKGVVDQYSPTPVLRHATFRASGLARGPHTLRIVVTGEKNASSTSSLNSVRIDAFDVTP